MAQQQQKTTVYDPLSGTTRASRYQKKHSPTHHPDHHPIFISFFHLLRSIASSLFKLHAWQVFCTTSLHTVYYTWKHFVAHFNNVRASGYNSAGSVRIWMKFGHSEYIVWSWPRQILGVICESGRASQNFFCLVNNARVCQFPVSQISNSLKLLSLLVVVLGNTTVNRP